MIKFLFCLVFLLFSFKGSAPNTSNFVWVGTMTLYIGTHGNYYLQYTGNYHRCIMKKFIDEMYADCDTIKVPPEELNDLIDKMMELDTCELKPTIPTKVIKGI